MSSPFDDILEHQIEHELKKTHGLERSKAYAELEQLAEKLVDKTFKEGYDNTRPEDPIAELKMIGAWDYLLKIWMDILRRFADGERFGGNTKELHRKRVEVFRSMVGTAYSDRCIDVFLTASGLARRRVSRAKHKQFLADGSWVSNGVKFGP